MYSYRIYNQLKKYAKADKSFHVPGHKGLGEFAKKFPIARLDITELSYSDNLFCPNGVIASAQRDIAKILGAKRSFILTDGSTCGVLSMLYVLKKHGGKVIIPRNCHTSVWNACRLFNIEPLIASGKTVNGVLLPPEPKIIENILNSEKDVAGMVALSPDYYGNTAPLAEYKQILQKHKKLLFVDEAHGAHLAFERVNGAYAGVYADIWVDGAHKSLPTLTQGAVISVNNAKLIAELEEALSIFRTTSPSYPVMASVEYGIKYTANYLQLTESAKTAVKAFKDNARGLDFYPADDWTKLVWDLKPLGICADKAYSALENRGIYAELSDGRYIIFYLSPQTTADGLKTLYGEINDVLCSENLAGTYEERAVLPENKRACGYLQATESERELVPLKWAKGRVCAVNAGLTPPCIPVICAGEIVSDSAICALANAKNTFGLTDGRAWVVK